MAVLYALVTSCAGCVLLGTALACAASRVPGHAAALERWGGALLVIGLALLGVVLHLSR